ncbi:metal-dependent hydrolase [Affinibrenneria salicis]|uniref:Metal-dependent hydrolase n=1 Tax=Affinibrenneria salicis TaxID=2590031 RepID=A0A5J5G000_9GAMM|nr:metal-dependent hydrolase [Affinibrenneria salicis]
MTFIDTHCHFDFPPFSGHEAQSLAQAAAAGVGRIIVPTVTADYFPRVLALAAQYAPLYAAIGLHPLYIAQHDDAALARLERTLEQRPPKLAAVGEIGLDRYMDEPQFDRQRALLESQLRLAKRYDLPVILHSRRTHDHLAQMLRRISLPRNGVVHGFAGSAEQALAFVRLGYLIGVGGTISYERASKTRRAIARLPLTSLLLETDAPDMPVAGYQGQPNRPERIRDIFHALCQLRSEPPGAIAAALRQNTLRLFNLK